MYQPRKYQAEGIDKLKTSFSKGFKKILMLLGTGGGKSIIVYLIFQMALKKNPNAKLLYIVHRSILTTQMKETLKGLNVEISTLQKIGREETEEYDLVLSDETHYGHGSKLMGNIKYKFWIGLTATGIDNDGYPLDGYDDIVEVAQLKDLIDWGFMPPLKVLSTSKVSTKDLKVSGRDFNQQQSFQMMDKSSIKKDIVNVYNEHAKGLKTIIYCVNVEHCENLKKEFDEAGIKTETVHSKKGKKVNSATLEEFRASKDGILINCDVLTTGLDIADIYCLIMAAPTKSFIKAIQIYGRLRLNPLDKEKVGLIIDCCEVIKNTQHPYSKLDLSKKRGVKKTKKCNCGNDMFVLSKVAKPNDDYTYVLRTRWKCNSCLAWTEEEELKAINYSFCSECDEQLEPSGLQMKQDKKSITFSIVCKCGFHNVQRQILLSDKELKEIEHEEIMNGGDTWEKVKKLLLTSCKRCGYNHRYSVRLIDTLKNRGKTPTEVIKAIEDLDSKEERISKLVYGYFK